MPLVDWSAKLVEPVELVPLTLPVTTAAPTRVAPSISSTAMCTGLRPATTSTAAAHTMITSIVPRSCWSVHDRHHHGGERDGNREPPRVEIAAMLMAIARERDDDDDLRDLRRLELHRSDLEPRLRALVVAPEHEHACKQRQDAR